VVIGLNAVDCIAQDYLTTGILTFDIQYTDFHLT
jgi:hypothetical protein